MTVEAIQLEHVPLSHTIFAAFFRDVDNAGFLQSQLLARNREFEYAFIDASSVLSRFQVLAATFKALTLLLDGTLKTPNVHSEIVYSLGASNNIADAYRRYGITAATRDVIILKIASPTAPRTAAEVAAHLNEHVVGTPCALDDSQIRECTDWARLRKSYKLNGAPALEALPDGPLRQREAEMLVVETMALRGL